MNRECRNCAAPLPADASFCPCCLCSQIEKHTLTPEQPERGKFLAVGVIAFVLTAALLWAFLPEEVVGQPPAPMSTPTSTPTSAEEAEPHPTDLP